MLEVKFVVFGNVKCNSNVKVPAIVFIPKRIEFFSIIEIVAF